MSKKDNAAVAEQTVLDKLRDLYHLQRIHSKIDEIQVLKGELPMEVQDLEDEIAGLQARITKLEEELGDMEGNVTNRKNAIKDAEAQIKKYQKQQANVKNNREFDALSKEIEMQRLEIQLHEKKIRDAADDNTAKKDLLERSQELIKQREKDLKAKKKDLDSVIEDTEAEEKDLQKKADKQQIKIEERLLKAYQRIRGSYKNGMAVVTVQRNSCGGCYQKFPPQLIAEIRQHKRIQLCEHCGRILVDETIDTQENAVS